MRRYAYRVYDNLNVFKVKKSGEVQALNAVHAFKRIRKELPGIPRNRRTIVVEQIS
ncbi:MAG: hypothetical protein JNK10_09015 [Cyclobacteriaceae bacterium]|nr:hypothetical protein [Cyclobacteriaceae bacterium]